MRSGVVTYQAPAAPGGALSQPRWLGAIGPVSGLKYSYKVSGGPDQMSCTLALPPTWRPDALNQGRIVQVVRGGAVIWEGKLLEAAPTAGGWNVTGTGLGNAPQDYLAIYTTWTNQNDALNQAITRGMRVSNPGVPSGVWLGQQVDSASQTMAALLDLFCTMGGYYWYISVNPTGGGGVLNVVSFPQGLNGPESPLVPNRLLTCTVPVGRNIGDMVNTLYLRYQSSANSNTANPTYSLTSVNNAGQATGIGPVEGYEDISSAQFQTAAQAQALGRGVLNRFIPVSYSGPFTVRQGEMLTTGGTPVDLGCEQAATICQALVTDYAWGDVVPGPIVFLVGAYEWDDDTQTAQVTPYQALDTSLSSMLSALSTRIGQPRTAAPKPKPRKPKPKPPVPHHRGHRGAGGGPPRPAGKRHHKGRGGAP